MLKNCFSTSSFKPVLAASALFLLSGSFAQAAEGDLFQNLVPIEGAKAPLAEIDPNADFSVFKRIALLETQVSFRSGWEREQRRTGSRIGISHNDVEQIRDGVAELFEQVFTEVLEADGGYEVVDVVGDDVLLIRPAIIDLVVNAPAASGSSLSTRTYTNETGSATLYIELFDSVSRQIIGRAADRQAMRNAGDRFSWSTSSSNRGDAERLFRDWAQALRAFLDKHYD